MELIGDHAIALKEVVFQRRRDVSQFFRRVSQGPKLGLPNEVWISQRLLIK